MSARKLELIGLVSLFTVTIAAVDLATMSRTGSLDNTGKTNVLVAASLISNAQASPIEHVIAASAESPKPGEQAPIYLDLGAKF